MNANEKRTVKTTCPRDCYDACGIVAIVRDGRVSRVLGDPEHSRAQGALCGKCSLAYNGAWLDPQQRLTAPLKRSGPKGSNTFVQVSWNDALADIAVRLGAIGERHGYQSVFHTHYTGTCALIAGTFPNRFFHRLGATEVDPDSVCNKAGHDALRLMFGNSFFGFDPDTVADADCLFVWGANPSASAPHLHRHWLPKAKRRTKLVVIDPIRHGTATLADLHLQLRPGTDALLAFAILHVLQREGKFDPEFLKNSVEGWDEIATHVAETTPEMAAVETGVPVAKIEQAATWYGTGKSMLWMGQGLQRQATGGNVMRSVALLPVATGNLGKRGTGFLYMNSAPARGLDMDWLAGAALRRPQAAVTTVSHMDLAQTLEDRERSRALFTWNNNIAASSPEQQRLRSALTREDLFHVAVDIFPTDTTSYADYVLPAATFLEFDDLILSYFDYTVSAQAAAVVPAGESLSNQEIFRRLARAMGLNDPALHESDEEVIAAMLNQLGMSVSFDELKIRGTVPWRDEPTVHFQDGVFPTANGKVQVASSVWAEAGMSRAPSPTPDARPANGRLRLLSPADVWLMNSSYANDSRIAARLGEQTVWINPCDAIHRDLVNGQNVTLKNEAGSLTVAMQTTENVPVGVALLPKGRWPSIDGSGGNVNVLNNGIKSDLGDSSAVHSIEVEMVAV